MMRAPMNTQQATLSPDPWFDSNELECELRGDLPWPDAVLDAHPFFRWAGIAVSFDENTLDVLHVAVDDGATFLTHHGRPCTDKRAAEIVAREWRDLDLDAARATKEWLDRRGY